MSSPIIRVSVRAAIVEDNEVLLVEYQDERVGWHFNYPGGGVELGESLQEALHREIREETCAEIEIVRLLHIWELVPARAQKHLHNDPSQQEVSFLFLCKLKEGSRPCLSETPDTYQTDVRWVPLSELSDIPLLPAISPPLLTSLESSEVTPILLEEL